MMNGKIIQITEVDKKLFALTDTGQVYRWSDYHNAWDNIGLRTTND